MTRPLFYLLLITLCWSCGNEATNTDNNTPQQLPDTPEAVTRLWQQYVDEDRFAEAVPLSTPRAQEWLQMIEKFLEGLPPEETAEIIRTEFTQMSCTENGDTAFCACVIKEEEELIPDTFQLQRIGGQWKVDVPEDLTEESEADMEGFIDSLMQELQE